MSVVTNTRCLSIFGVLLLALLVGMTACTNPREGYAPEQPVAFSHALHAGDNEIDCKYCHVSPGEGRHSSVPSVNTCMNCHSQVAGNSAEGKKEIQKIRDAWKKGEPIRWVKVHDQPDLVSFSHQPHIMFGLDCTECHGDVNTMDVISVQNPFNMGWCVDCHREPEHNAPIDCTTCHY